MSKFCANGHMMEDSWEICPYCPKSGYVSGNLAKTRLEGATAAQPAVETRMEAAPSPRGKTVLIAETKKPPVLGWLVAMSGHHKGEDFRVREGQNLIGSAPDCEIVLQDPAVSARHASLRYKDSKFYLTDLDSSNGTFLNEGAQSIAREELKDGDMIRLGDVAFKFKCL